MGEISQTKPTGSILPPHLTIDTWGFWSMVLAVVGAGICLPSFGLVSRNM